LHEQDVWVSHEHIGELIGLHAPGVHCAFWPGLHVMLQAPPQAGAPFALQLAPAAEDFFDEPDLVALAAPPMGMDTCAL